MIPTEAPSWDRSRRSRPATPLTAAKGATHTLAGERGKIGPLRLIAVALLVVLLTACTNSKLIIAPLYNRLDDQIRSEFNKLADFNDSQTDMFEQAVGTFHVWHRRSEMPKYADLLQEIAGSIATPNATNLDDVAAWAKRAEHYSRDARECHPGNYLFGLMRSLTDQQITVIERRFNKERQKNTERYASQTREERIDRRLNNIVKWAGRIGLDFTEAQRGILRDGLTQQVSLRKEYYALSSDWNSTLFVLARNQGNPAYDKALADHVGKLWTLLEDAHPAEWHSIRDLWRNTIYTLITTLSDEQRNSTSRWLAKMGSTILAISKDEPSFTIGNDPAIGCLPTADY